ncbi:MAG: hypothetical protein ACK57W_10105 [Flavobacteriales bacterium]|jgi:hypothetical protein
MTIYTDILKHLADNENGQFIDITSLHDDFEFLKAKTRELQIAGRIEIKSTGVYAFGTSKGITSIGDRSELKKIRAKILLPGYEYLKQMQSETNTNNGFSGSVIGDNFSGNAIIIGDKNEIKAKLSIDKSSIYENKPKEKEGILDLFEKWWWAFVVPIIAGLILIAIEHKLFQ